MPALAPARRRSWVGAALRVGAATTAGGVAAAVGAYYWDPSVRRAVTFWSRVGPIAGHYVFAQKWHASDPEAQRREYERLHDVYAPASLEVVLELRGLLVKFGQQLSSRPELVPHQYVVAFRRLQAEVPAEPASIVIALVEAELGRPIGELYARFDERPCGAASIAQAHRALTPDGREVVVKVQFPLSAPHFHADLRGLRILVRLYSPEAMPLFDEFSKQYLTELDFERERESLETIRNAVMPRFGHFVEVPEVDANRCSSRVLTMGYVPGEPLERSVRAALEAAGVDASRGGLRAWLESQQPGAAPAADGSVGSAGGGGLGDARSSGLRRALMQLVGVDSLLWAYDLALRLRAYGLRALATLACTGAKLALLSSERADSLRVASEHSGAAVAVARASVLMSNLFDVYGFELFELGFFNSDPHPGNVLVMPDGRLGLIDYGQCKRISVELQAALAEVIVAVAEDAPDAVVAAAFRKTGFRSEHDDELFTAAIARVMLSRVDPRMMRGKARKELFGSDKIAHFPPDLMSVWRAVALLRGSALSLRCNISPAECWREKASRLLQARRAALAGGV